MKSAIAGAIAFFMPATVIALLFTLAGLSSRAGSDRSTLDDFVLAAYLILFSMTCATAGFLMATATMQVWRRLTVWRAMLIAAPLGLLYPVFYFVGLIASAHAFLPLFHSIPWLAGILTYLFPGVLLGLMAVGIAAVVARRPAQRT